MDYQNEVVLQIVSEIKEKAGAPCKKKLQKIIYLIEALGEDLGFEYKLHIYGPYSADLDYTICELKAKKELDIEYTNGGHILECQSKTEVLQCVSEKMRYVIDVFGMKTPADLEVITTALFAQRHMENKNDETVIEAVKKIKGKKFSESKIREALQLLKDTEFISA